MKGKKVRVFGKTLGQFVEATGGAPTLISGSEQYLAYQRGTVDVGMTGVSSFYLIIHYSFAQFRVHYHLTIFKI